MSQVRLRDKEGKKPADLAEVEEIKRILEFEERSLEGKKLILHIRQNKLFDIFLNVYFIYLSFYLKNKFCLFFYCNQFREVLLSIYANMNEI